jgi:hypothetical protein
MSDTAHWTETDRTRALHWVRDRATTRSLFRIQGVDLAQDLPALRSIREPQNLAQALRLVLTEHTWQQLLLVLGRRQDAPKPPPDCPVGIRHPQSAALRPSLRPHPATDAARSSLPHRSHRQLTSAPLPRDRELLKTGLLTRWPREL